MPQAFDHPLSSHTSPPASAAQPWAQAGTWTTAGDEATVGYEAALPFLTATAADSDMPAP